MATLGFQQFTDTNPNSKGNLFLHDNFLICISIYKENTHIIYFKAQIQVSKYLP